MHLHEFQSKAVVAEYDIPVPRGGVATSPREARTVAEEIGGDGFVVKAQVLAGDRASGGGIRRAGSAKEVEAAASELIGSRLVTAQTGAAGRHVQRVHVEEAVDIAQEIYVAALVDQTIGKLALVGSAEGGSGIEEQMASGTLRLEKLIMNSLDNLEGADYKDFAGRLGLTGSAREVASGLLHRVCHAFVELDASLIEFNPLAVTSDGRLSAVDVKMIADENALFRHPDLAGMRDFEELDPLELEAQRHEINFLKMHGNIGVAVNGAGLALATLDMLEDAGGSPANFMDIRTMASSLQIARGFNLLLENPDVKAILVNIHGGGLTKCDTVAEGLGISMRKTTRRVPIVFRAAGNNADFAHTVLANCGVKYTNARDMRTAIDSVVAAVSGEVR